MSNLTASIENRIGVLRSENAGHEETIKLHRDAISTNLKEIKLLESTRKGLVELNNYEGGTDEATPTPIPD